jgi:hypothetical protein
MGLKHIGRRRRARRVPRTGMVKETVMRGDGRYFVFYWFDRKAKLP